MTSVIIGAAVASLILSFVAIIGSVISCAFVIGFKNSTHQVQLLDPSAATGDELAKEFEELEKKMSKGVEHV